MKRLFAIFAMLLSIQIGLEATPKPAAPAKKVLVVFFSHTGNTRGIARQIQEAAGADIFEIQPVAPYPTNYKAVVDQAKRELGSGYRPPLKSTGPSPSTYKTIFIGSPNWFGTVAPPVMTYLSSHNFSGKRIVPFVTHGGSRMGKSVGDVRRLAPGATVVDGRAFWGNSVQEAGSEVRGWMRELQLLK